MRHPARAVFVLLLALALLPTGWAKDAPQDPNLWLEEVEGEKALAWVVKQNAVTHAALETHPAFAEIESHTLSVLQADDRLVVGRRRGDWMYDFWRDREHPRGLYRRTPVAAYLAGKCAWETVLDLDALAAKEGRSWVWRGMQLRYPDYQRGLLRLSDGGSDAVVVREFDLPSKRFVADGFTLPEAKGGMAWIDDDTVFVRTDFGEGAMTEAGYPRIVKRWRRGTPLAEAELVYEGRPDAVSVEAEREHDAGTSIDWLHHSLSFYTAEKYIVAENDVVRLDLPATARIHTCFHGQVLIEAKEPWTVGGAIYEPGTVVSIPLADLKAGAPNYTVVFEPDEHSSLTYLTRTKSYLLAVVMKDVRDTLHRYEYREDGTWALAEIPFPGHGTTWLSNTDADHDTFAVTFSSFLKPSTLYWIDAKTLDKRILDKAPERFDPAPYASRQHFATSKDGTRVPYFLVGPKEIEPNGANPVLLGGYGGFRIPQRPRYLGAMGKNWLDRGGLYVVANIRGGGEYGPRWHEAARREKRHKAFEDFEAIAEDLVARKLTTPELVGIRGGSNGGLLVGACLTRRPELFGAVVCQAPLLDMQRYGALLAGASWIAEYGDPDVPEDWAFLKRYSPYHNLAKDRPYPRALFTTSTKDDRVHPGHARKMAARMQALGYPALFYENTEGGHAGAADAKQRAHLNALVLTYLLIELGD